MCRLQKQSYPTRALSFTLCLMKSTGLPATYIPAGAQAAAPAALLVMTGLHAGLLASRTASNRLNTDSNEQALGTMKPRVGSMGDKPWQMKIWQLCHFLRTSNSNGPHILSGNHAPATMLMHLTHMIPASTTHPNAEGLHPQSLAPGRRSLRNVVA